VFREKAVEKQARNFDLLLAALPKKVQDQVMDVIDKMLANIPYDSLKAHLMGTHTLSDQEKMDVVFKMEPWMRFSLGG
jgi:hypothetical protein